MNNVLEKHHWWQRSVLYEVYLRSFYDSNNDGVGDLPGLIQKLDYFQWLGVKNLWLCPIFPSPNVDNGYDVSDYKNVHPEYGNLTDFDRLVAEMHHRGMKLILDFVPNHTSNEHPWFCDSRSSRDNPFRSWYLWRDAAWNGGPPNNWLCTENSSAWEFDETTKQYYLHSYLPQQPDLNWRNPQVRLAMLDVLRFWLDRGVDGFRVDAIAHLIKDQRFRDNPPNPSPKASQPPSSQRQINSYSSNQAEVHEVIAWLRNVVDMYQDRIIIGEVYLSLGSLLTFYGPKGLTFPFNFEFVNAQWSAPAVRAAVDRYEAELSTGDWPNWVLGNHDCNRIGSRIGREQLRIAAMLLMSLRGTPTMYYGDELGMLDGDIPVDRRHDPHANSSPGFGRDPERTPMQWDARANAGFTSGSPWLPVNGEYQAFNVNLEQQDPASLLNLYHDLITLRNSEPALTIGNYTPIELHGDVVAYLRSHGERRFLIALNFSGRSLTLHLPPFLSNGRIRLATESCDKIQEAPCNLSVEAHAGVIFEIFQNNRPEHHNNG